MQQEPDSPEQHRQRSEFIRNLVQGRLEQNAGNNSNRYTTPQMIVQFWHDLEELPNDVEECIASWTVWGRKGFSHRLYDVYEARKFISEQFSPRHTKAFERCYHPAMQADYFRLCYLFVEGGMYVDADDVCVSTDIAMLFEGSRLKLQPLCYDTSTDTMVKPAVFLDPEASHANLIFYFNNNPLIVSRGHPIIRRALKQATSALEILGESEFPEIQSTTGPGNLSKAIFELGMISKLDVYSSLDVIRDWDSIAVSKWPLSYRHDSRNWRLSNNKRYNTKDR